MINEKVHYITHKSTDIVGRNDFKLPNDSWHDIIIRAIISKQKKHK
jgi:hypothetical protein